MIRISGEYKFNETFEDNDYFDTVVNESEMWKGGGPKLKYQNAMTSKIQSSAFRRLRKDLRTGSIEYTSGSNHEDGEEENDK